MVGFAGPSFRQVWDPRAQHSTRLPLNLADSQVIANSKLIIRFMSSPRLSGLGPVPPPALVTLLPPSPPPWAPCLLQWRWLDGQLQLKHATQ